MPSQLPPPFQRKPFSTAQARASGVAPQRLRRSDLTAPFRGVRSIGACDTLAERCRALVPILATDQFVSHVTSLFVWGLPLPERYQATDALLHVTSIRRREPRRRGIVGHRNPAARDPAVVGGVPASDPVTAWVESRALLSLEELVVVGDAIVSRWSPLPRSQRSAPGGLLEAAHSAPRVGRNDLIRAAALVRQHSRSPMETRLRLVVTTRGMPCPELNYVARNTLGQKIATVDLAYPEERLALEYEGEHHFTDTRQYHVDIERREALAEAGWRTIRITKHHVFEAPDELRQRIARHLGVQLQ